MPAGSGPQVIRATGVAITASEVVVATSAACNWSAGLAGILLGVSLNVTPGASQTSLTVRLRQGGLTGTLVGITHPETTVAAQQTDISFSELDNTAFAVAAQNGATYTLTIQGNAAGPGTVNQAVLEVETTAPVA